MTTRRTGRPGTVDVVTAAVPLPPGEGPEVGDFRQGTPGSRWALGRYLVGRAVVAYLDRALYVLAILVLGLGAAAWWLVTAWLGVPLVLVGLAVLGVRALVATLVRGLTGTPKSGPADQRLNLLVDETRADVRRELRRIGLPSRPWTLPLLGIRLAGRRRAETFQKLREFRADNVVSASRVDELHLLLGVHVDRW
jgi:hypothetical protein